MTDYLGTYLPGVLEWRGRCELSGLAVTTRGHCLGVMGQQQGPRHLLPIFCAESTKYTHNLRTFHHVQSIPSRSCCSVTMALSTEMEARLTKPLDVKPKLLSSLLLLYASQYLSSDELLLSVTGQLALRPCSVFSPTVCSPMAHY